MKNHECNCKWCAYDPSEDPDYVPDRKTQWYINEPDAQMRALSSLASILTNKSERQEVRTAMRNRMRELGRIK